MPIVRRAGLAAAAAAAPLALAWRFALAYRVRAGYPRARPPRVTPSHLGLAWESITVEAPGAELAGWFIPARGGAPGPGVVLVHGWESARDRTLPFALVLNAIGFHCLTIDVRGHGANRPEALPVSAGEFGLDALAAFEALLARPEVTHGAIAGHSMGGIGAILAAAADPRVHALVATSAPAEPYRLTRQTFRLAHLPIPDPVAYPLAWFTTRVFLRPRRHTVAEIDASRAIARYAGPVLLIHGDADDVVPVAHIARLERAARSTRTADDAARVRSLVIPGGRHSWLYEFPAYRTALAGFLAEALDGPVEPARAEAIAADVPAQRIPDGAPPFSALTDEPGGLRTLGRAVARPGGPARPHDLPDEVEPVPGAASAADPAVDDVPPGLPAGAGS